MEDNLDNQNLKPEATHDLVICQFVEGSGGLVLKKDEAEISILQKIDGRSLKFKFAMVEEVISRLDSDGKGFLQVNFTNGRKILITENLVGFKPAETSGLDLRKLPKVVTTPDLVSVIEAIEDSVNNHGQKAEEIDVLRRVFDSVLNGAEAVGFEVGHERNWLNFIANTKHKASA